MAIDSDARGLALYANSATGISAAGGALLTDTARGINPLLRRLHRAVNLGMTSTGTRPDISRPATNIVRTMGMGDSIGDTKTQFIVKRLRAALGMAGQFFTAVTYAGGAAASAGTAGTYWVNGSWSVIPAAGSAEYLHAGGRVSATVLKIYYVKRSGAGTFKVQVNAGAGYVDEAGYTAVDANNATTTAGVITLNKAFGSYSVKIVGVSGTVEVITSAYIDEQAGGLLHYRLAVGGLALSLANETPSAIKQVVFNDLAADLAFIDYKDGNRVPVPVDTFPVDLSTFLDFYRSTITTPTDWALLGSTPESLENTDASWVLTNNAAMKAYADAHDLYYFDGYTPLGNYNQVVALGWEGDGTHLAVAASAYLGSLLWSELGFDNLMETPLGRPWRLYAGDNGWVGQGSNLTWEGNSTYPTSTITQDGFELIVKGSRSFSVRNAAGTGYFNVGTGSNGGQATVGYLAVMGAANVGTSPPSAGPALRGMGVLDASGMYCSGIAPGNGSTVAPFLASELRIGATTTTASQTALFSGTAMPTTGTYNQGSFVWNLTPALSTGKVLIGWSRLTTGSGHVLNTDWAACYVTNS